MGSLGGLEIVVIAVVALLVFGPKRLPEVSRQVGGALRELRRVQTQVKGEIDDAMRLDDSPPRVPRAELESRPVARPGQTDRQAAGATPEEPGATADTSAPPESSFD